MASTDNDKTLRFDSVISQMTLQEKASLMSGENFWNTKSLKRLGVPSIMLTDGPHGLRKQGGKSDHLGLHNSVPATCFPTAATLANSWDKTLLHEVGERLGTEAAHEEVSVVLGPGLNIKRNPLCGRNFEYFSEDPYLAGKMAAQMVQGIQSRGVSACPKHFAVNSQETRRMLVDEVVDKRALHEIYLEGFRYAIEEGGADTIMTSYNKVDGCYANENDYLLQTILHDEWGFDGLVVTDWGGNNDRVKGLIAGNTLEMPATNGMTDQDIVSAVQDGTLSEVLLDKRVDTFLSIVDKYKTEQRSKPEFSKEAHHQFATDAACRSAVLLKNDDNTLPLTDTDKRVAVIGDFAETPRYQGAGSSLINPTFLDSALEALKAGPLTVSGFEKGFKRLGKKSGRLQNKAVNLARRSDVVLLFLGLDESREAEGVDRPDMRLAQNQLDLFNAVNAVNQNIVVVLAGGSPVELPFIDKAKAVLHVYLPGQGGGAATAKLLTGQYNPGGKLAESYTYFYADVPSANDYPGGQLTAKHKDSLYIGYRYYDSAGKEVLFPFGYGLSYTTFEYSHLEVSEEAVAITITNTGKVAGEEIVQLYVKAEESAVFRPEKELKGFAKMMLEPGQSEKITIPLDAHAFAFYHTEEQRWVKETGRYTVMAAASSRDIRLKETLYITGEVVASPYDEARLPSYYSANVQNVSDDEFEALLGEKLPPAMWDTDKVLGYNDIIEQGENAGRFGRFLVRIIWCLHRFLYKIGKPILSNNVIFALGLPFRSVARMSGGMVNMAMLDGILLMVNGHFWKGLGTYIKAGRAKRKEEKQSKKHSE